MSKPKQSVLAKALDDIYKNGVTEIEVCKVCKQPVEQISDGHDELVSFCELCNKIVEGNTEKITEGD